jgi:predicted dehydrogenase
MQQKSNGMNYAPQGAIKAVCGKGEFPIGVVGLDHGHIYGMCNGLKESGADVKWVYDPDPAKVDAFRAKLPEAAAARAEDEILDDPAVKLVASASVPDTRCPVGLRAMDAGKHFFTDKPPCVTLEQVAAARKKVARTGLRYAVYYSERLHVESAVYAEQLVKDGAIGRVVQVLGTGPHRISLSQRPEWFFHKSRYGGILVDIGCHQIEQFLFYTGAADARVLHSATANYNYKRYPEFEDFGQATFQADNGATGYFRVDWFTPDGLPTWGDGRTVILGTEGYIELRKYVDVARDAEGDHVYLVDGKGARHIPVAGKVGFPFFGRLVRDCLDGTHEAYDQELFFRAIELAITAQQGAVKLE